jgi:disulfide bond formation protein DsbB
MSESLAGSATLTRRHYLMFIAWLVALGASLGALFLGEIMGNTPCVLCWYQRIAMFPLAIILGIAFIEDDERAVRYALPLSLIGAAIAAWHGLVYAGIIPESVQPCMRGSTSCSGAAMTLFGFVPLPVLSLAAFAVIVVALILVNRKMWNE